MVRTMNDNEALNLLKKVELGRLGCVVDGEPYVVPMNYVFEDGNLYSHSLPGVKTSALRENPRACVQVDSIESEVNWRSVLAFGKYEEISDSNERAAVLSKLFKRFPLLTPVESSLAMDADASQIIVFRIRIERVTGVAEGEMSELELVEEMGSTFQELAL